MLLEFCFVEIHPKLWEGKRVIFCWGVGCVCLCGICFCVFFVLFLRIEWERCVRGIFEYLLITMVLDDRNYFLLNTLALCDDVIFRCTEVIFCFRRLNSRPLCLKDIHSCCCFKILSSSLKISAYVFCIFIFLIIIAEIIHLLLLNPLFFYLNVKKLLI